MGDGTKKIIDMKILVKISKMSPKKAIFYKNTLYSKLHFVL